jgi:hypothetical protein
MSQKGTTNNDQMTPNQFKEEMSAFVAHILSVFRKNPETGRAKFPGFREAAGIISKRGEAINFLAEGKIESAFRLLDDARQHFQNCQASYAKSLSIDLWPELDALIQICQRHKWQDLINIGRRFYYAYVNHVEQRFFDLDDASRLYWDVIDALDKIEGEIEIRKANAQRKQSNAETKASEVQKKREEEREQKRVEECATIAAQMEADGFARSVDVT